VLQRFPLPSEPLRLGWPKSKLVPNPPELCRRSHDLPVLKAVLGDVFPMGRLMITKKTDPFESPRRCVVPGYEIFILYNSRLWRITPFFSVSSPPKCWRFLSLSERGGVPLLRPSHLDAPPRRAPWLRRGGSGPICLASIPCVLRKRLVSPSRRGISGFLFLIVLCIAHCLVPPVHIDTPFRPHERPHTRPEP